LATKLNCKVTDINNFVIWGNHSATQYPDITHAKVGDKWATDLVKEKAWLESDFYPTVQKRGAGIVAMVSFSEVLQLFLKLVVFPVLPPPQAPPAMPLPTGTLELMENGLLLLLCLMENMVFCSTFFSNRL
jgi:hypothetical protein